MDRRKPCYVVVQLYDSGGLEPLVSAALCSCTGRRGAVRYVRDQEASYREYHAGQRMRSFGSAETGRQLQIVYAEGRLLRIKWKIVKM